MVCVSACKWLCLNGLVLPARVSAAVLALAIFRCRGSLFSRVCLVAALGLVDLYEAGGWPRRYKR